MTAAVDQYCVARAAGKVPGLVTTQWLYRFPNGLGASVIQGPIAYGEYELGVLRCTGSDSDDWEWDYTAAARVFDHQDVVQGYTSWSEVEQCLQAIAALDCV